MTNQTLRLIATVLIICTALVGTAGSADKPPPHRPDSAFPTSPYNSNLKVQQGLAANDGAETPGTSSSGTKATQSLGEPLFATSASPGVVIGDTWYDQQHNGRMPRMVDWGYSDVEGLIVHFLWTYLPDKVFEHRKYQYAAYLAQSGTFVAPTSVQPAGDYAGFVALDVTDANEAVASGHNNQGAGYQSHTYWDFAAGWAFFGTGSRVPDSVSAYGTGLNWQVDSLKSIIWPDMIYQEVPGETPVLHMFAQVSEPNAADPQAIYYFRKEGAKEAGNFDYPPYVVDTVFDIAQSLAASNTTGKMALVWIANRPDDGDCDTCSSQQGQQFVQWDNDIYYQISTDRGVTFEPRVNMTMNQDGVDGYRPYTDLSPLIDSNDDLHIAWNGRYWPADANSGGDAGLYRCRMFHWGQNLGTGGYDAQGDAIIRTAVDLNWDQTVCTPGSWNINGAKMSLSECDGKLYYLYVQFNDIPVGIENDCAARGLDGTDITGAANGELYLAVSDDGGLTWDQARNLTNSRTPGCDSASGIGGECDADHWPSMARFGTDHTGNMTGIVALDPSGTYAGNDYLDVQYINDKDPGRITGDEGTWQLSPVKWFRLACVEPAPNPQLSLSRQSVGFPEYTQHGVPKAYDLTLENLGNIDVTVNVSTIEEVGPFSGWLAHDFGASTTILRGVDNTVEGSFTLNNGGVINSPGTIAYLKGGLVFTGNQLTSPDTLPIEFWVTDTLFAPTWDTLATSCVSLLVQSNGNFGDQGRGRVNLDFFNTGDCDTVDSIPGETEVYLYDGSPVICWVDETDTVRCNYSMFGEGLLSEHGFIPMSNSDVVDSGSYTLHTSEFVTRDTAIGLERTWVAPDDDCFMVAITRVYAVDGETHNNLIIGEAVDWDIPSDSGTWNNSGFIPSLKTFYQVGAEFADSSGDALECQDNDERYGGVRYMGARSYGSFSKDLANFFTKDNATQVYPEGHFNNDSLWYYMGGNIGYSTADTTNADLHMVLTAKNGYSLSVGDTLTFYTLYASVREGSEWDFENRIENGYDWACSNEYLINAGIECGCCVYWGDVNGDGGQFPDIADLVYLVAYMFSGGPAPVCLEAVDCNGNGEIDIEDLVCLINPMFLGGTFPECP